MPSPGPTRSKHASRGEDEARVDGRESVIAHPEAVHDARAKVLRHHVDLPGEARDDRCAVGVSQVDHDALLAAVEHLKITGKAILKAAQHTPGVAIWRLDLQHPGPQLCQHQRRRGPLLVAGKVQNRDAVKGPAHLLLLTLAVPGLR